MDFHGDRVADEKLKDQDTFTLCPACYAKGINSPMRYKPIGHCPKCKRLWKDMRREK